MRKAERLFQLLTFLQAHRQPVTAATVSEALEVSKRTVYRDMTALMQSGIPINSEAGIGYQLDRNFLMAPMMFSDNELAAIRLGMSLIQASGDDELKSAATKVLQKVQSQLNDSNKHAFEHSRLIVPKFVFDDHHQKVMKTVRDAIKQHQVLSIDYIDAQEQSSQRQIEPLGIMCYVRHWTLIAWCQNKQAYRAFRLDRIQHIDCLAESFQINDEKSLQGYLDKMQLQYDIEWLS